MLEQSKEERKWQGMYENDEKEGEGQNMIKLHKDQKNPEKDVKWKKSQNKAKLSTIKLIIKAKWSKIRRNKEKWSIWKQNKENEAFWSQIKQNEAKSRKIKENEGKSSKTSVEIKENQGKKNIKEN